jgi:hypothetical protein
MNHDLDPNGYARPLAYWGLAILLALALNNAVPMHDDYSPPNQAGLLQWIEDHPAAAARIANAIFWVVFMKVDPVDNENGGCGPGGEGSTPNP